MGNKDVKAAIARKKKALIKLCKNESEENNIRYRKMRNQTSVCKSNENGGKKEMDILCGNPNNVLKMWRAKDV